MSTRYVTYSKTHHLSIIDRALVIGNAI